MNKHDVAEAIRDETGVTKAQSERAADAVIDGFKKALKKGDRIDLHGFGTFQTRKRAARDGVNPLTREKIKIKERRVVIFKAKPGFTDSLQ